MDEYYCPNCGATLNHQYGFDPNGGSWTCSVCGTHLMDEDVYNGDTFEGVAWYCDKCNAFLNRQSGFSDAYSTWRCTQCGHLNGTTEDDIINTGPQCPNCSSYLKKQSYYGGYEDDWTCEECGAKLHRKYSCDPYEVIHEDEGPKCPHCGDKLNSQFCYSEYKDDWTCESCGAKLHRRYSFDPYEEIDDSQEEECSYTPPSPQPQSHSWEPPRAPAYMSPPPYSWVPPQRPTYVPPLSYSYAPPRAPTYMSCNPLQQPGGATPARGTKPATMTEVPKGKLRRKRIKAFLFRRKRIKLGYNPQALLRKHYQFVFTLLHNNAFENIKCIPVKDIYTGSPYAVGEVEQVVINGSQHFSWDDLIPYDTEIIITYHIKREISVPFSSRSCRKKNHMEIGAQLQKLGFTNIYAREIRDLTTGWIVKDGSIEKVIIGNNERFKKNTSYVYDIPIVIEYHTFKNR